MGGCTSKPKVLKDDQAPENVELKEEVVSGREAPVAVEGKKEETAETVAAPVVVVDKENIIEVDASSDSSILNTLQEESQLVTAEEKEVAVDRLAEQVKEVLEEGKDSSPNDPEVVINEAEQGAKSDIHPTEKVIPAVEEENAETLKKKPDDEEKKETQEEKKKEEEKVKPQPDNNPFASFISSLMGQKRS